MTARRPGVLLPAAVLLLLAAAAGWADTLDDRVYAIASQLMCPVCTGQTVAESDSAVAREMRDVIRAKLQAGETPDAILNFFVGQFGESVLAEPPRRGLSLLLYLGPAAGVAAGLAIAVLSIRRWTGRPGGRPAVEPRAGATVPPSADSTADGDARAAERARLARELEARDRF
ncbi:MAG TPA: cytochrome c-type biogenesis protein CcmH [bacterium]|nr:cytochrome c-type biogenesis protein CcmH [bacterium]